MILALLKIGSRKTFHTSVISLVLIEWSGHGCESLTFWLSAEQSVSSSGRSNRNGGAPILRLFSEAIILESRGRASCRLPREVVLACQSGQSSVGWAPRQHSVHLPVCQPPPTCCSRCSTSSTRPRAVEPVRKVWPMWERSEVQRLAGETHGEQIDTSRPSDSSMSRIMGRVHQIKNNPSDQNSSQHLLLLWLSLMNCDAWLDIYFLLFFLRFYKKAKNLLVIMIFSIILLALPY